MAAVIDRTAAEGLPDDADGFVVARNDSGARVVWCDARAKGWPVYVVKD